MIKTLELTNFRQHEDLKVKMTEGLNVLRGPNESGKSTLIEAVLYALYGAKALRDTLAETVTWGKKETELRVIMTITVSGCDFIFRRAKSGATCEWSTNEDNYLVTGQTEVTAKAIEILGADAKTAASLMLADQSGLRGALDDGPAAVSGLMSKLADFDLIDQIIEAMQAKLLLGSEAPTRQKLINAELDLAEANENAPDPKVIPEADKAIKALDDQVKFETKAHDSLVQSYNLAHETFSVSRTRMAELHQFVLERAAVRTKVEKTTQDLDDAKARAAVVVDVSQIENLKAELHDVASRDAARAAYAKFEALPKYPDDFWEGSYEEFDAELTNQRVAERRMSEAIMDAKHAISMLKKDIVVGGICSSCGTDISKRDDIVTKNAEIEAKVKVLEGQTTNLTLVTVKNTIRAMEEIKEVTAARSKKVDGIGGYVVLDHAFFPPKVFWHGNPPADVELDTSGHKAKIAQIEAAARAVVQAEGAAITLTKAIDDFTVELAELETKINAYEYIDLEPLEAAHDKALFAMSDHTTLINNLKDELATKKLARQQHLALVESHKLKVENAQRRVKEYESDLTSLAFNNVLLKKMRGLKPSITDHLWNTVLAAVSNFFSQLRGENSVVTKDAGGFKVNGHGIDSLSGSTLDVLALAVRVALTKTFIPHTDTMILDEPAHGCDDNRTASMLGFLSSVGFGQTLVASHDELSEAVADNIITLGA